MQAEGAGEGVDEHDVCGGGGDDVCQVELVEVGVTNESFVVDVADYGLYSASAHCLVSGSVGAYQDKKHHRYEEEETRYYDPIPPCSCRSFDVNTLGISWC